MTIQTGPPAVPVFPAGRAPVDADFAGWVTAPFQFLTSGVLFRAEQHTGQAFAANTSTVVQYDTVLEDPYAGWNPANWQWTPPFTGQYEVTCSACLSVAAIAGFAANVVTPYATLAGSQHEALGVFPPMAAGQQVISLIGGTDWVSGAIFTTAAATANTVVGRFSAIEIRYISQ